MSLKVLVSESRRSFLRRGGHYLLLSPVAVASYAALAMTDDLISTSARMSSKAMTSLILSVTIIGSKLVAVGERGIILLSSDGGANWHQMPSPSAVTLTGAHFPDGLNGWVVGHSGVILHTRDGGKTWELQFDGNRASAQLLKNASQRVTDIEKALETKAGGDDKVRQKRLEDAKNLLGDVEAGLRFGPARPFLDVWFADKNVGYVVGSHGQFFETRNGGKDWQYIGDRLDNPDGYHINAIIGTPSEKLAVVGEMGNVWISHNRGSTWVRRNTNYRGQLYGVLLLEESVGSGILIAYGFAGTIFSSTDWGRTWHQVETGRKRTLIAGHVIEKRIFLVDAEGAVVVSDDLGATYKLVSDPVSFQIRGAAITSGGMILCGFGGLHKVPSNARWST